MVNYTLNIANISTETFMQKQTKKIYQQGKEK